MLGFVVTMKRVNAPYVNLPCANIVALFLPNVFLFALFPSLPSHPIRLSLPLLPTPGFYASTVSSPARLFPGLSFSSLAFISLFLPFSHSTTCQTQC